MCISDGIIKARNGIPPVENKERSARNEKGHSFIGESQASISVYDITG